MKITLSEHPLLRQWIQEGKRIIPPDEIEIEEPDYERMLAHSSETHPRYTSEQRQAWAIYNCWEPEDFEMIAPPSDGHPEVVISTNRIEKHLLGIQLAMASEASKLAVEISDSSKSASKELIGAIQEFSDQNTESLREVSQIIKTGSEQMSNDLDSCILRLDQMVDYAGRFDIFLRETIFSLRASFKWGKVFWILDLLLKAGMVLLLWLLLSGKAQAQGRGTSFLDCINFDDAAGVELFGPCSPFRIREGSNITFSLSGETLTISGPAASGITTLNTLSGAIQTFAAGTAGADFGISSAGTTHTFNIPSSSALNRGLLVAADWSTFNGKENVLTFSTGLTRLVNAVSCDTASALQLGCLSAANWSTFNGKQDALGFTPVPDTRLINTTAPLGGGGALSGDLTLTCTGCLTSVTAHALLSATHTGTVAAAPVRGDIIIANLTPAWTKLALGAAAAGRYARSDGTDVVISTGSASGVGACAASNWASTLNADAAPTCTQPAASDLSNGVTGSGAVVLATTPTFVTSALSPIFSTTTADPADAGILRLANGETICWEASPTGADFCITGNASEQIAATTFAGALVGNSDTTTALAADPTGCTAGGLNFTNDINTSGTSTCADVRTASATQTGIAELATTAEVAAGTDTGRTVTPSGIAPSIQTGAYLVCSDAGASDTYTCTMTPTLPAYTTGMEVVFRANTVNTGAATLNVDSLGAITIVKLGGGITTALADNDLRAGQWTLLVYDGTNFQMQGQLGNAGGGSGTVNSGTQYQLAQYATAGTAVSGLTYPDIQTYTSGATWTKPLWARTVKVILYGGGGSGAGGASVAAGTAKTAGSGGGGGAKAEVSFLAADLGATVEVTVAAATTGGVAATNGAAGNQSCFSTSASCGGTIYVTAFGGGAGRAGATGTTLTSGGGGGGVGGVGEIGQVGGGSYGGQPQPTQAATGVGGGGGGGQQANNGDGRSAEWGGSAGGGSHSTTSTSASGGSSMHGAAGGGAGAPCNASNSSGAAGAGGNVGVFAGGGGGTAGTAGTPIGGNGTAGSSVLGGQGGGGGYSSGCASGTSAVGGNGGLPGGGGGGGGAGVTGGAGGNGAAGEVWVISW